ncbi:22414_t:CDS:2 [Cetraspora pellucida]|uniref:22414_t:CDS:1 n=1 Tax=Cetraspora pellucida TaxID=1433469 RepID=A0A9N9NL31_9GLOM|nr:22414_t:CDS:2 [Cetraspora pellucida]
MANSGNSLTKGGNLKRADLNTAFKKYSISNCLLRSKDHLIYENDSEDTDEDTGEGSDENTNKENDFNNWPECFVVI